MSAVYKRELKSYFCGMTGAVFMAFLLLMSGIYTTALCLSGGYPGFEVVLSAVLFVFLLVIPIITMRSISEDMHTRTDQLLYALPLPLSSVVLAKYLAMTTVLAIPTGVMCLYPVILSFYGEVNYAAAYGALLGFFLLGCALIAIGMFLSSLTESQVIAAVLTFAAFILMYLMNGLSTLIPVTASASLIAYLVCACAAAFILYALTKNKTVSAAVGGVLALGIAAAYLIRSSAFEGSIQKLLSALAFFDRFTNFANGIFDITALVYYLSVAVLFVFFTVQSMEKRRWA
ncbi:MAG: ABC transporter permease [Eubacteriales bacterium]